MSGKGAWPPGDKGGCDSAAPSEGSPTAKADARKITTMASVTPAARPVGLWMWDNMEKLDPITSQSLPVTPNHPPLSNSARLVPMRSTPQLGLGPGKLSIGRRSAPGTPMMGGVPPEMLTADGKPSRAMEEMLMRQQSGMQYWADDVPETPPLVGGTPPFVPRNMMGGYGGVDNMTNLDVMQFMMMNAGELYPQGGNEWRPQERRHMGHHHHHHHHMHHHHHHHQHQHQHQHQHEGMAGGGQIVRLQVDPRTTLDVPRHHLRFTQRAEGHLRNHGHVGWCQRHHNTGSCNFGNGCAFAHVVDSMIEHYRQDAENAIAANHARFDGPPTGHHLGGAVGGGVGGGPATAPGPGGKGGKGGMHHMPPHMMGGKGGKGGGPPPLAGLMGGWHGKGGKGSMMMEEREEEGRGMWGAPRPATAVKDDVPQPTLSSMLSLGQRGAVKPSPQSTLSGNAPPFVRPARYWNTQFATAPEGSMFVGLHDAVCDAIGEALKVPSDTGDTSASAQERAQLEIGTKDSWTTASSWLAKQAWGRPSSVAMDLCVAAGLHERPVEVLTGKMKRILKSCVNGRIRHVDLSLSIKEIGMRVSRDMGLAIASELRAQAEDLSEVSTLSLNHWELNQASIAAIGTALPPRVETVELLWVTGEDKWLGISQLIVELRQRNQSSRLKIGVSDMDEARQLTEALTQVPPTHKSPLVEIEVKSKAELGHDGRQMLSNITLAGLKVRVPAVYIPPVRTGFGPAPEELRVMCNDPQIHEVLNTLSAYLTMPESQRVNRVFFRGITANTAPLLGEGISLVLNNPNVVSMELQIARDTKSNLHAMLPVLQQQAMKCAMQTKLRNLLIELKEPPEPELLDVCLLLPVKHILLTVYSDRNQLERVLPPFIDKLKKLDPPSLSSIMIDYGRGYGHEHGMCRITGPWSKCHMEWVSEDEADQAAEDLRDPSCGRNALKSGLYPVPGRFSHTRIAAEVVGRPLGECPMSDAIVVHDGPSLISVLQTQQVRVPRRTTIAVRPTAPGVLAVDLSADVVTVAGVEFLNCDITVGAGADLVDCVFRGGNIKLHGGKLEDSTLINTTLENTEGATITNNKFVTEELELPEQATKNLVMLTGVNSVHKPLKNENMLLPVPKKELSWHSPSAYFVKKDNPRNQDVVPVQGEAAAVRLCAFATLASGMHDRGLMVVRPVGFGCDAKSSSCWVVFDTRGAKLSDKPSAQWATEGTASKASASISACLEELAKNDFAHGRVSQDNIYVTPQDKWVLGTPSAESPANPLGDGENLQKVVNWALTLQDS